MFICHNCSLVDGLFVHAIIFYLSCFHPYHLLEDLLKGLARTVSENKLFIVVMYGQTKAEEKAVRHRERGNEMRFKHRDNGITFSNRPFLKAWFSIRLI